MKFDENETFVCAICGALVGDNSLHTIWHHKQDAIAQNAARGDTAWSFQQPLA